LLIITNSTRTFATNNTRDYYRKTHENKQ